MPTTPQIVGMAVAFAALITLIVLLIVQPWAHASNKDDSKPDLEPQQAVQAEAEEAWLAMMQQMDSQPFVDGDPHDSSIRNEQQEHWRRLRQRPRPPMGGTAGQTNARYMLAAQRQQLDSRATRGSPDLAYQRSLQGF